MALFVSILLSFLIAVLSGMGVGGGGLLMIVLTLLTDLPQLVAQGINLLFFLVSSGSSLLIHLRKRSIRGSAVVLMAAAGIVGAWLGAVLAPRLPDLLLRRIFGCLLIVSGMLSLQKQAQAKKRPPDKQ